MTPGNALIARHLMQAVEREIGYWNARSAEQKAEVCTSRASPSRGGCDLQARSVAHRGEARLPSEQARHGHHVSDVPRSLKMMNRARSGRRARPTAELVERRLQPGATFGHGVEPGSVGGRRTCKRCESANLRELAVREDGVLELELLR